MIKTVLFSFVSFLSLCLLEVSIGLRICSFYVPDTLHKGLSLTRFRCFVIHAQVLIIKDFVDLDWISCIDPSALNMLLSLLLFHSCSAWEKLESREARKWKPPGSRYIIFGIESSDL